PAVAARRDRPARRPGGQRDLIGGNGRIGHDVELAGAGGARFAGGGDLQRGVGGRGGPRRGRHLDVGPGRPGQHPDGQSRPGGDGSDSAELHGTSPRSELCVLRGWSGRHLRKFPVSVGGLLQLGCDNVQVATKGVFPVHIPDGYLSPSTCAAFYGASVPVWVTAGRRVQKVVKSRYVPLVAIGAAYSFLVMMFNVPIPDGTTAHAVGGVLVAVLLGPWAAVIAVSIALLIQALFFGDGGVLAYGANAFNMAIVMPFVGYAVYRALVHRNLALTSPRRPLGAAIGAYVGINAAALCAAVEFGLQPDLFHTADGTPLYAPFHLTQTIPAMLFAHLLVAGVVEAALTAGVITYLQRANRPVLQINQAMTPDWEVEE